MDKKNIIFQPTIMNPQNREGKLQLEKIKKTSHVFIVDTFLSQLNELFQATFPKKKNDKKELNEFTSQYIGKKKVEDIGIWVYFPWKNALVHILPKEEFYFVRTCRNNPLILPNEQKKLYQKCIGIVGLSVGNSIALSLAYSGIGNHYKLADFDELELSNLNRVRTSLIDLGNPKVIVTARAIYEIDPYCSVEVFREGLTEKNFAEFFQKDKKIDVVFDECDSLMLKFFLRLAARSLRIPLVMASDIGYKTEISIINFDQDINAGDMKDVPFVDFNSVLKGLQRAEPLELSEDEKALLICELLGVENITDEMKDALILKKKEKIVSYPQLGAIAFIGGGLGVLAMIAKERYPNLLSPKTSFHFMDAIAPPSASDLKDRKRRSKTFKEIFGIEK